jgi:hypothetical protein
LFCQILSSYYLRWDDPSLYRARSPINLDVAYDTRHVIKGESLTASVSAQYTGKGVVRFPVIDMGIPPGFKVGCQDLEKIRNRGIIERFEIDRGRLVLYLSNLDKKGKQFQFGLQAVTEARVKMPEAKVYDYYNPEIHDTARPVTLVVQ